MRKEVIAQASTIEEAQAAALAQLGLSADRAAEVTFETLQVPQKKTFGLFGGTPAEVKAIWEETLSPADAAAAYLRDVLAALGVGETEVSVTENEDGKGCTLALTGEDLGFVIGRRGDTLDALQYLVSLIANHQSEDYYRVTIDIGNYREKRERSLTGLAKKNASQVARTGRRISLEPMNPYERRIIHTAVQSVSGATSWSVGSEPNRYVIIGPSDDNPNRSRGRGGKGRRPQEGDRHDRRRDEITPPKREIRQFVSRSNPLPDADGATPPARTESATESSATLYGRINL